MVKKSGAMHSCTFDFTVFAEDCMLRSSPNILRDVHTCLAIITIKSELQAPSKKISQYHSDNLPILTKD